MSSPSGPVTAGCYRLLPATNEKPNSASTSAVSTVTMIGIEIVMPPVVATMAPTAAAIGASRINRVPKPLAISRPPHRPRALDARADRLAATPGSGVPRADIGRPAKNHVADRVDRRRLPVGASSSAFAPHRSAPGESLADDVANRGRVVADVLDDASQEELLGPGNRFLEDELQDLAVG